MKIRIMRKVNDGFTLIELVVVIALVGIVAAAVTLRSPNTNIYDVDSQATNVLRDIRLTQALAVSYNVTYQIIFSSGSYQITDSNNNAYNFPGTGSSIITLPNSVTLTSSTSTLKFNNRGEPLNAVGTALSSAAIVTLTASNSGDTRTITIQPQTGFSQ